MPERNPATKCAKQKACNRQNDSTHNPKNEQFGIQLSRYIEQDIKYDQTSASEAPNQKPPARARFIIAARCSCEITCKLSSKDCGCKRVKAGIRLRSKK